MKPYRSLLAAMLLLLSGFSPLAAEKISLKFTYSSPSIGTGDLETWVESYNNLWQDWQALRGGSVQGGFVPIDYGPNLDWELSIPIFKGLSLNLGGSQFSSLEEGTITYQNEVKNQREIHYLRNQVRAYPFRIGFSYSLPIVSRFHVVAGAGRHIVFIRYKSSERYDALFQPGTEEYSFWFEKENTFRSESLGIYATLSAELYLMPFLGIVAEAEKTWTSVDGFKGPFTYDEYNGQAESGKASLYYYESSQWGLDRYYPVLAGHEVKPDESGYRSLRQGELNFSGFCFKMGLKLKF